MGFAGRVAKEALAGRIRRSVEDEFDRQVDLAVRAWEPAQAFRSLRFNVRWTFRHRDDRETRRAAYIAWYAGARGSLRRPRLLRSASLRHRFFHRDSWRPLQPQFWIH